MSPLLLLLMRSTWKLSRRVCGRRGTTGTIKSKQIRRGKWLRPALINRAKPYLIPSPHQHRQNSGGRAACSTNAQHTDAPSQPEEPPTRLEYCFSNLQLMTSQPRGRINFSFQPTIYFQLVSRPSNTVVLSFCSKTHKPLSQPLCWTHYFLEIPGQPIDPDVDSPFQISKLLRTFLRTYIHSFRMLKVHLDIKTFKQLYLYRYPYQPFGYLNDCIP